ncbi:hypothetical protein EDC45_0752 [Mesocricetibacter intestinalis]|uniref:Uncharacterized protein n=1 Tax=Mesocricetibacter intestinalis TaxID=1521930 RepID=A0A4R6VEQ2_9PAST|nr:hypothetical protein [Mesocricetibacter intestinalis]TDQ58960.1 hypothetical protein EDC45_0752 [Mesocricetibacter intestinalis]
MLILKDKLKYIPVIFFYITGCSSIVYLIPNYSDSIPRGESQWINIETKENVTFDVYTNCYHQGIAMMRREQTLKTNIILKRYEVALYHGKCLRDLGFVFKPDLFSIYCYHYSNKESCRAFKNFRN